MAWDATKAMSGLREKLESVSAGDTIREIALADIARDPHQPRQTMDQARLKELSESIKAQGLLQPVVVRKHPEGEPPYMLVVGERRWRAAQTAGLTTIRALVRDLTDEDLADIRAAQIIENREREGVAPVEEAVAIQQIVQAVKNKGASERLGRPASWISKMTRIASAPALMLERIRGIGFRDADAVYELTRLLEAYPNDGERLLKSYEQGARDPLSLRRDVRETSTRAKAKQEQSGEGAGVGRGRSVRSLLVDSDGVDEGDLELLAFKPTDQGTRERLSTLLEEAAALLRRGEPAVLLLPAGKAKKEPVDEGEQEALLARWRQLLAEANG